MPEFYNPYHFVPATGQSAERVSTSQFLKLQDASTIPPATQHLSHDRYVADGKAYFSGRLVCQLTTVTPLVVGAQQHKADTTPTRVDPYQEDNQPAIPATSLRGLLSSLVETLSDSAMRVLVNERFSYRSAMTQSRGAIGMLVEREINGKRELRLRPLTLPPIKPNPHPTANAHGRTPVPDEFQPLADQLVLPVYLDRYDWDRRTGDLSKRDFLTTPELASYSADHARDFWSLPLVTPMSGVLEKSHGTWVVNIDERLARVKRRMLIGLLAPRGVRPCRLPESELTTNRECGILRVLGISPSRESSMPHTKFHELFIPVPDLKYFRDGKQVGDFDYDLEVQAALNAFHAMADQRTERDGDLPFELAGQDRAGPKCRDSEARKLRLRAGDLVYFRLKPKSSPPVVDSIAISSIWREDASWAYEYFPTELLPFRQGKRASISLAEQMFGFVPEKGEGTVNGRDFDRVSKDHAAELTDSALIRGLASRVRVSSGRLWPQRSDRDAQQPFLENATLKILASPKPPCPVMYFKQPGGGYIAKSSLKTDHPQPQGRKMYLHHPTDAQGNLPTQAWQHDAQDRERLDLHLKVTPIRPGISFVFHIDFENFTKAELGWLCRALRPSNDFLQKNGFLHKLGLGKPLGLGSVRIAPVGLFCIDRRQRYSADALFGATRYHATLAFDPEAVQALPDDLYSRERGAGSGAPLADPFQSLPASSPEIAGATQLLGTVPTDHPVHYPATTDAPPAPETDHFHWFMANDDERHHQALAPLEPSSDGLPTLRRLPKKETHGH